MDFSSILWFHPNFREFCKDPRKREMRERVRERERETNKMSK
jgi:hypothetical protein